MNKEEFPHRRLNLLTGEYVLVSPHRMKRPWQGQVEPVIDEMRPAYDPNCYLCPGNSRSGGEVNPDYDSTFVFTNDFAALLPDEAPPVDTGSAMLQRRPVRGTSRVICFSPRHDLTLPEMPVSTIRTVVDLWSEQSAELGKTYKWVQLFQNKGATMGASNPHPHGQVWALDQLPNEPFKEDREQHAYFKKHGTVLLQDYLDAEVIAQERIVVENDDWVVVVPYWAFWPYETLLMPRRHVKRIVDLSDGERNSLAAILKVFLTKYDNLFTSIFPYSMGWHGAPYDDGDYDHWQLHAHFYPPLLRSATVKKFRVGFELLGEEQRDITAEKAAETLRGLSEIHYRQ